ncbi:MAG: glycosyltransferase, partial [Bifidobacteriaceae bacterium]|nr:glycosyltransferase [Bifidobacteriaceae bacterium]
YAAKAAKAGRRVALVYDAREFVPGLAHVPPKQVEAYSRLEAEFIQDFDRIVTVSEGLAELLVARHGLRRRPAIVMNGPMVGASVEAPSLREVVGVGEDAPLLVYSGVVNPARGIGAVVRALALVDGVHLALVVNNRGTAVTHLLAEADRLGLADRLHLAPYVAYDQVTKYVASADAGVSPLSRAVNHDIALTNKFCEYVVAGLPVVTSDTPEQARLVEDLDLGAVFKADDVADCARAIKDVLDRRRELATRIGADQELRHRFTWAAQVETLARVYREVAN